MVMTFPRNEVPFRQLYYHTNDHKRVGRACRNTAGDLLGDSHLFWAGFAAFLVYQIVANPGITLFMSPPRMWTDLI